MRSIWRYGQVMWLAACLRAWHGGARGIGTGADCADPGPGRPWPRSRAGRARAPGGDAGAACHRAGHAAGAGDRIAATIRGSDYPPAARAAGHRRRHATRRGTRDRRPARPDHRLATGRRRTAGPSHGQAGRAGLLQRPADTGGHPRRRGTDGRAVRHPGPGSARRQGAARTAGPAGRAPCRPPAAAGLHPGRAGSHLHAEPDQHRQRRPAAVRRRQRLRRLARGGAPGVAGKRAGGPARRRAGGRVAAGRQGEQPRGLAQAGLPAAEAGHVYGIDADALYRPGPA